MEADKQLSERGADVARREYSDHVELAADFGPATDIDVDVVGETVIVVTDGESYDIDVDGTPQAFIKNGVLTIELDEEVDS